MNFFRSLAMLAACAAELLRQRNTLALSCPATTRGSSFHCSVALSGQASAGAQATINVPPDIAALTVTAGASAVAATKNVSANMLASGKLTFIVWGVDTNLLQPGAIADIAFDLVAAPAAVTEAIGLSGAVQADLMGTPIPTAVSAPAIITRLSPCDVNGDGQVDAADVSVMVGFALVVAGGGTLSSNQKCDLNGDGACDFIDSQIV